MSETKSAAEQMFCKLLVHNKLMDELQLKRILGERGSWSGANICEELENRSLVKKGHLEKVKGAVVAKGFYFESEPLSGGGETVSSNTTQASAIGSNQPQTVATESSKELFMVESSQLTLHRRCSPQGSGVQLLGLLDQARQAGASDLHICTGSKAFFRSSQGDISSMETDVYGAEQTFEMLSDLISTEQKQRLLSEQQLDFALETPDGSRFRSNIVKERKGWAACFRLISNQPPSFKALKLPAIVQTLTEYATGLVLISGPMGSGKTTTMAAMVDVINANRKDHIITMEDPIEYRIAGKACQVTQRGLGNHTVSFANALKGALRQDPDVIMVGELRDLETMSLAMSAAETGHLVLASLHTNSAERTVDRLVSAFPPDQQSQVRVMLAESLRGVLCQQLLPKADGSGSVLALEVLVNNTSVKKCIVDNKTFQLDSIIQTGKKQGMVRMDDAIASLLQNGEITRETAESYVRNVANLK